MLFLPCYFNLSKQKEIHSTYLSSRVPSHLTSSFLALLTKRIKPWHCLGFTGGSVGKESASSVEDGGSIPAWEIFPGEGNGNPP